MIVKHHFYNRIMSVEPFRQLPSVNDLLLLVPDLVTLEGHRRVVEAIRWCLDAARIRIRAGALAPSTSDLVQEIRDLLRQSLITQRALAVINATGVIIHTNLGRAVLSQEAQQAISTVAMHYSPLEFDLQDGERGQRGREVEQLLCAVNGAEAALVVNNCAAATVLMLSTLARGKDVVISRGQLVEIGGGFRIPEILEQSGARLVEVGATNRTRRSDYEQALHHAPNVGAILHVHASNFKMVGFTQSVPIAELVDIAHTCVTTQNSGQGSIAVPVLDDVGSGAILDTSQFGLSHEPMPQESVSAGAALVTFSGDKLLGGPQAGIIIGRKDLIDQCRKHPLARAFRADKFTLAALGATLVHYLRGEAVQKVPIWRMIAMSRSEVHHRAEQCVGELASWFELRTLRAAIIDGESTVGGGSLPGDTLPTSLIALRCDQPTQLLSDMRKAPTPVIARIRDDQVLLDLRTVLDDSALVDSLRTM